MARPRLPAPEMVSCAECGTNVELPKHSRARWRKGQRTFYCSKRCSAASRVGQSNPSAVEVCKKRARPAIERFEEQYFPIPESGCWIWEGASIRGYGSFKYSGGGGYAHRYAYEHFNDAKIPDGMVVMHTCDVPACVNPSHLVLGTQHDNVRDAIQKDRGPQWRNIK